MVRHGPPEVLSEREVPIPDIDAEQLVIRVAACSVCGHDALPGGYAEYVVATERNDVRLPAEIPFDVRPAVRDDRQSCSCATTLHGTAGSDILSGGARATSI